MYVVILPKNLSLMLRRVRTILAVACVFLVTLLFLDFTGVIHHWFGWLSSVQFIPAVLALNFAVVAVLVLLTLLLGRIYCSVVCPLGILQDVVSWLRGRRDKKARRRFAYKREVPWLRYTLLAAEIAALVAGVGAIASLLEPYSAFGRIATAILQPLYRIANNGLAAIAAHFDSYAFYSTEVWIKSVPTLIIAALTLAVVAVMAWRSGRLYCNTVCPVGSLLGLMSRFAFFKVRFDEDKCISCGACERHCKASCIDFKNRHVDYSRCVVCGDCLTQCKVDALNYCGPKSGKKATTGTSRVEDKPATERAAVDAGKRAFLVGGAIAAGAAVMAQPRKKLDGGLAAVTDATPTKRATPILPPGAVNARRFARTCTACQLCVSDCPTHVLVPSGNLLTLMQPTMDYSRGACRPECNRCSQVCPSDAIQPITISEKSAIKIGTAVWHRDKCVVLTQLTESGEPVNCGNCARHCPVHAIEMVPRKRDEKEVMVPVVNIERCIGCGMCESVCPARPFTAIHVEGLEEHRTV